MNRKLILGRDWLKQNGVRLYFDLGCIRLHQTYIPLQEDIHVTSIVLLRSKTKIKPQTAVLCSCKIRPYCVNPNLPVDRRYQISLRECGFLSHEPGLMVTNSVGKLKSNRVLPIMIVNTTTKTYTVRKGCPVAKVEQLTGQDIMSVSKDSEPSVTGGVLRLLSILTFPLSISRK